MPSGTNRDLSFPRGGRGIATGAMIPAMIARIVAASIATLFPAFCAAQTAGEHAAHLDLSQGIPLVQVRIDGKGPFTFVVDTGTNVAAIVSPRIVKRLGLPAAGHRQITDLGGKETHTLDEVQLDTLSLAGTDFRAVRAAVADLPDGDSVLDGILGFGLFRNTLLTLDYPRHRLVLSEGGLAGATAESILPMRMPHGIPTAEISIAGMKTEAGIDSGAAGLSVPSAMAARLGFVGGVETVAYGRTQVSSFELRGGVLDGEVDLAGFRFGQPWLEVNPVFSTANLGSGAMRDFAVTFDQRGRLVRFAASGKRHRLAKPKDRLAPVPVDELVGTVVSRESY